MVAQTENLRGNLTIKVMGVAWHPGMGWWDTDQARQFISTYQLALGLENMENVAPGLPLRTQSDKEGLMKLSHHV